LRHGDAEPAPAGGTDFDRRLTDKGVRQARRVGKALARLNVRPEAIISSPLVRARQTAEIVADQLGAETVGDERLECGAQWQDLRQVLEDRAPGDTVLFVGHEPDFSGIVSVLIGGADLDFKKGAVACVECRAIAPAAGTLLWFVPPRLWK
jgi:phosphohistidine phosphatase